MRFPPAGWKLIQGEAERQGISATEFVRMAALAYAIELATQRGARGLEALVEQLRSPPGS